MNMFFVYADGRIATPELNGSILEGVTRASVLDLAADLGHPVEERRISVDEVISAAANGRLSEAFGTGTAAVVSPVSAFVYKDEEIKVGDGKVGPRCTRQK